MRGAGRTHRVSGSFFASVSVRKKVLETRNEPAVRWYGTVGFEPKLGFATVKEVPRSYVLAEESERIGAESALHD